jgi:hypothetical protein
MRSPTKSAFGLFLSLFVLLAAACSDATGDPASRPAVVKRSAAAPLRVFPTAVSATLSVRDNTSQEFKLTEIKLSRPQLDRLRAALVSVPQPNTMAACFVPHHQFDFMDARGRKVGQLLVCFCCSGVSARPNPIRDDARMLDARYDELRSLVTELGSSPDTNCGPTVAQ